MTGFANKIVSVIIVTCGRLNYLKPSLDSIRKQSYENLEVKVINNTFNQELEKVIADGYPEFHFTPISTTLIIALRLILE